MPTLFEAEYIEANPRTRRHSCVFKTRPSFFRSPRVGDRSRCVLCGNWWRYEAGQFDQPNEWQREPFGKARGD